MSAKKSSKSSGTSNRDRTISAEDEVAIKNAIKEVESEIQKEECENMLCTFRLTHTIHTHILYFTSVLFICFY